MKRIVSMILALVMVLGLVPVSGRASGLSWHETELDIQPDRSHRLAADGEAPDLYAPRTPSACPSFWRKPPP